MHNIVTLFTLLIIDHFRVLAKSTELHCAFHLRKGGVVWPSFSIVVVGMVWK